MRILYPNDLREPLRRKLILNPSNTSNDKNEKHVYLQCRNPRRIAPFLRILTSQKECISCCPQALYSTQFRFGRLRGNAWILCRNAWLWKAIGYIFAGIDFNDWLLRELFDWQLQMKKYQLFFLVHLLVGLLLMPGYWSSSFSCAFMEREVISS